MNNIATEAKMGQITLVTPPDFVQNQNRSFCLVNFSKRDKDSFASQLNLHMSQQEITLYLWDDNNFSVGDSIDKDDANYDEYLKNWQHSQNNRDYNWLLNACNAATTVIINMEYISRPLLVWSGYILTLAKTYFINGNEKEAKIFNVLNRNRIESIPKMFERLHSNKEAR